MDKPHDQNHPKEKETQESKVVIWVDFANKQKASEKGKDIIPNW